MTYKSKPAPESTPAKKFTYRSQQLYLADCREWLAEAPRDYFHAVITDPPYGLIEFEAEQQRKLRSGRGGVWRIPPSFDGANRRALPRFTTLTEDDRRRIFEFFFEWCAVLLPTLRPGAHVFIASNPLVSPIMSYALEKSGLERRGEIVRLVRTFRGGDRPKGAETEFAMASTMPRSCWEPWGLFRKPLACRTVAENLRTWSVGALKRVSHQTPFLDVIQSSTTPDAERYYAPHPSVKPQAFLRHLVRASLPMNTGTVLDPFAGSGTTLAACQHNGVEGVGVESDPLYFELASKAISPLSALKTDRATKRQRPLPGL